MAELDPKLGDLARRYYDAAEASERLALAQEIAGRTIPATGFFEWETPFEALV